MEIYWAIKSLLQNACDYTDTGSIRLNIYIGEDQHLKFAVHDTGIGISAENQEHIFAGFYRVMNVDDDRVRGIGLGLYVSKAIVEAHDGLIEVNSTLGEGSTFIISLPIVSVQ